MEKTRKLSYLLMRSIGLFGNFYLWNRYRAQDHVSTQVQHFSNISEVPKILTLLRSELERQILFQVCYTIHQVSFYLWRIGPLLKNCNAQKYYDQDCLTTFLELSTLSIIQISGKSPYLAQKKKFYEKSISKQSWKFCKAKSWRKPIVR